MARSELGLLQVLAHEAVEETRIAAVALEAVGPVASDAAASLRFADTFAGWTLWRLRDAAIEQAVMALCRVWDHSRAGSKRSLQLGRVGAEIRKAEVRRVLIRSLQGILRDGAPLPVWSLHGLPLGSDDNHTASQRYHGANMLEQDRHIVRDVEQLDRVLERIQHHEAGWVAWLRDLRTLRDTSLAHLDLGRQWPQPSEADLRWTAAKRVLRATVPIVERTHLLAFGWSPRINASVTRARSSASSFWSTAARAPKRVGE